VSQVLIFVALWVIMIVCTNRAALAKARRGSDEAL